MSFRTFSFLKCLVLLSLSVSIFSNRSSDDRLSRFSVFLLQPRIERPSCESSLLLLASNLTLRSTVGLVLRSGLPVGLPHQRTYENRVPILFLLVLVPERVVLEVVRGLNDAVPRLIGLVLRLRSVRLVPEVLSEI